MIVTIGNTLNQVILLKEKINIYLTLSIYEPISLSLIIAVIFIWLHNQFD